MTTDADWGVTSATVTAQKVPLIDNVDLPLRPGELIALVGPSGAGKTTLLRVIAGMIRPDTGHVTLDGRRDPWRLPRRERAKLVGMMQQRLDLVAELTVRHNIQAGMLGGWGLGRSLAALLLPVESPLARDAAARLGLEDRLDERVANLSGGEQQRVALARLLVQSPHVLLADEPVASLDPARAGEVLAQLAAWVGDDARIVVASLHDPALAQRHFDRVVGVRHGRIAFDVPAERLSATLLDSLYEIGARRDEARRD